MPTSFYVFMVTYLCIYVFLLKNNLQNQIKELSLHQINN